MLSYITFLITPTPPCKNGRHFADDIFKYIFIIFMNGTLCIVIQIVLKCLKGDKSLPEPVINHIKQAQSQHFQCYWLQRPSDPKHRDEIVHTSNMLQSEVTYLIYVIF